MSFDKHGFLGNQINEVMKDIYDSHKDLFDYCYELNDFAYKINSHTKIHKDNGLEVIGSSLHIKILNGFQATVILSKRGLDVEAKIITRTILEALFVLKSITENPEEVITLVNTDKKNRENLLKLIFEKDSKNIYGDIKARLDTDMLEELKRENKDEGVDEVKIYQWAQKADLEVYHKYAYTHLNSYVHTDIRNLERYLQLDENRNIIGIDCIPSSKDIKVTLFTASNVLLFSLNCMCKIFSFDYGLELKAYEDRLVKFVR